MAYIEYLGQDGIPEKHRVGDTDNILRIHEQNAEVMKKHYELYLCLMRKRGGLTRIQRETIAVVVSSLNGCHY